MFSIDLDAQNLHFWCMLRLLRADKTKWSYPFSRAARRDKPSFSTRRYCGIKSFVWFSRYWSFFFLIAFFLSTEGKRKDPEEFWSTSGAGRLTSDDEEALASQQETQTIFFIQQVAWRNKKECNPSIFWWRILGWSHNIPHSLGSSRSVCYGHRSFPLYGGKIGVEHTGHVTIEHRLTTLLF